MNTQTGDELKESAAEPSAPASETAPVVTEVVDLEALKAEAAKAKEHWEQLLRTAADLENFKKRAARERQDAIKYANEALLEKLLPVIDNFEAALAAAANADGVATRNLVTGVNMIAQQLKGVLTEAGLQEVEASGQVFDPNLHEAVSQEETDAVPEGQVARQLRKGYKLRDRLIRPASVVVAKKPAGA